MGQALVVVRSRVLARCTPSRDTLQQPPVARTGYPLPYARIGTYPFVHVHPVMRQPAAPFCRAIVSVEPVCFAGVPFNL